MPPGIKTYDIVVIGSGGGAMILEAAVREGRKVALIDKGPLGGTCANIGCIPTKIIVASADRVLEARDSARLGVKAEVQEIDFSSLMERMRALRLEGQLEMRHGLQHAPNLDYEYYNDS